MLSAGGSSPAHRQPSKGLSFQPGQFSQSQAGPLLMTRVAGPEIDNQPDLEVPGIAIISLIPGPGAQDCGQGRGGGRSQPRALCLSARLEL